MKYPDTKSLPGTDSPDKVFSSFGPRSGIGKIQFRRRSSMWSPRQTPFWTRTFLALLLWLGALLVGTMVPIPVWSFTGDLTNDPADIVKTYVRLDSKGVRLEAIAQEALQPYIDWTEDPAWGKVIVVSSYEVVDDVEEWQIKGPLDVLIPVTFQVVGTMYWDTALFVPHLSTELIWFHVKGFEERWKIIAPHIPPHVTVKRMINFVRQAKLDEKTPERQESFVKLRSELEEAAR